ncbi:hypothetical protein BSU04_05250 [Caballeronia sordidicola]|uniref:Uncharacterized protein n=1 Tax=Caballeronia sordidicola TaxID=196367 RepID=A0A226X9M9_CABSO|nr:hypothetical protein BSU04_05250 [Caballeronia sordidicola]
MIARSGGHCARLLLTHDLLPGSCATRIRATFSSGTFNFILSMTRPTKSPATNKAPGESGASRLSTA